MGRVLLSIPSIASLIIGCSSSSGRSPSTVQDTGNYGRPTVFARGQGEQRMMRGTRPLFILADSATVGSRTLVAGYEEVPPGDSGRTHMHLEEDELLFVHRGELEVRLGDSTYRAASGASIFVPRRTWIHFRTVGQDTAGFLFVFNAPAFEKCLRALSAPVGERYVALPASEMERVGKECHRVSKAQ
jgi:ethanolamine utilization protein EutQ (cupin superfamily)